MNQLLKMKLLSFVVLLVYVLEHHNSFAVTCDDETSPSDCDCSVSCSPCQTTSYCNKKCNCCQATTRSPITTTTNPYSTTTRSSIKTTTTSPSSTEKPPSHETNIDIRLVNVINTTNELNVPIGISLVNRNNVIQFQKSSTNSTTCRRRQCRPSSPEGTDWETVTIDRPPRIEQASSTTIPSSTTIASSATITSSTTTQSSRDPPCDDPTYTCQNYPLDGLLGLDEQQILKALSNPSEGGVYGIPISTQTSPEQSDLGQPLVYNWLRQLQGPGFGELQGLGYGEGQRTPYNQLGGYQYLQPLAMPYNQPLGSSYNQPPVSSYNQPLGSSYIQHPWSPYNQP